MKPLSKKQAAKAKAKELSFHKKEVLPEPIDLERFNRVPRGERAVAAFMDGKRPRKPAEVREIRKQQQKIAPIVIPEPPRPNRGGKPAPAADKQPAADKEAETPAPALPAPTPIVLTAASLAKRVGESEYDYQRRLRRTVAETAAAELHQKTKRAQKTREFRNKKKQRVQAKVAAAAERLAERTGDVPLPTVDDLMALL